MISCHNVMTGDRLEASSTVKWLTKLWSWPSSILKKLKASPPPLLPVSMIPSPTHTANTDLHPIVKALREHELGKLVFNLAVPITILLLFSTINGNSQKLVAVHDFVLVGLMVGCVTIWNALLFRHTFSGLADILEQLGISLVLLFVFGLVASFLSKGFSWACWLSGICCLIPFIYARVKPRTALGQASDAEKMVDTT